jgi:hypothetical protein
MIHIDALENLGIGIAAISDKSDGDGSSREGCERILEESSALSGDLVLVNQVHGSNIVRADQPSEPADGIITDEPGEVLGIRVADCVPIWLVDPHRKAAGIFHAGRKGTYLKIAALGMKALSDTYGCDPPNVKAYIGPSAGPCCYEVSEELAEDFKSAGLPVIGRQIDLWEANRRQLKAAGLKSENVYVSEKCTICSPQYYSYRRNHTSCRNLCVVSI